MICQFELFYKLIFYSQLFNINKHDVDEFKE